MQEHLLDFPSVPATREHFAATVKVIDAQIDEIDERKAKLQAARAALAAMAGIDRSEHASGIGKAVTAASRSIYEGHADAARFRGHSDEIAAADLVIQDGKVIKSRNRSVS